MQQLLQKQELMCSGDEEMQLDFVSCVVDLSSPGDIKNNVGRDEKSKCDVPGTILERFLERFLYGALRPATEETEKAILGTILPTARVCTGLRKNNVPRIVPESFRIADTRNSLWNYGGLSCPIDQMFIPYSAPAKSRRDFAG